VLNCPVSRNHPLRLDQLEIWNSSPFSGGLYSRLGGFGPSGIRSNTSPHRAAKLERCVHPPQQVCFQPPLLTRPSLTGPPRLRQPPTLPKIVFEAIWPSFATRTGLFHAQFTPPLAYSDDSDTLIKVATTTSSRIEVCRRTLGAGRCSREKGLT
jgi:hypothetical protein